MASTFTTGFGIEKIGSGEQDGAWGTTTNHNLDILDRIASYKTIAITANADTATLTVREASPGAGTENLQDGMYRVIKFTGALDSACTITIAPNTAPAWFIIENATTDSGSSGPYSIILSQGSGANVTVQNGKNVIIYCDGAGGGAAVVNALSDLQIATLEVTGAAAIDGALTAAAITGTTLTTSGIVSVDDTTTSTSGTTGSIHTDGGLGVAGTAFVAGTAKIVGVTTHGDDVVSDTDSTDDLGTTGVRWANLFVDGITATDQVTATGFTGTLDGILGSGTPAAATATTVTTSGILSVDDTTTSTSGTTGSIHTDGGLGVAGTAFVAGTATVGGASQFNSTVTVGVNDTGYDVQFFGATSGRYMLWDESADTLLFPDVTKVAFGTHSDLSIFHDGSNSYIQENGTGDLLVGATSFQIRNADFSENYLVAAVDGAVTLYHNNVAKIATASTGVTITGEATATGFTGTLDGILGSGTPAAATVTTLTGTTITAQTAFVPDASDGAALGTTALEFSDLFLADGAVINLGDDQDVTITHVADTGIALNSKDIAGVASINSGQLAGNRNIIINGDFTLWQRGTADSALSASYLADRWIHGNSQTALHTRQAFSASGTHPGNSQYVLRASGDGTSTVSRIYTAQGIESINCIPLRGKTITMSLYLRCAAATMPTSSLGNLTIWVGSTSATADASVQGTDYSASGNTATAFAQGSLPTTWTKITNTYTVPTNTNNILAAVGFASNVDAGTGDWYEISQVQIEIGSTATPFEQRLFGTELALCQRYLTSFGGTTGYERIGIGVATSTTNAFVQFYLPVTMRAAATLAVSSVSHFLVYNGAGNNTTTAITSDQPSPQVYNLSISVAANLVTKDVVTFSANNTTAARLTLSAEL